jgi:hypothetical protein
MKVVSTRAHGVFDFAAGLVLMVSPWLYGFQGGGSETWIAFLLGAATLLISSWTDYEMGRVRRIPVRVHLAFDVFKGAFLLVAPWAFGFAEVVYAPYVVFGGLELLVAFTTQSLPSYDMSNERTV